MKDDLTIRLFYRRKISELLLRLDTEEVWTNHARRTHKKNHFKKARLTKAQIADILNKMIMVAENSKVCLDSCANSRFCELPVGHKGPHMDSGVQWD